MLKKIRARIEELKARELGIIERGADLSFERLDQSARMELGILTGKRDMITEELAFLEGMERDLEARLALLKCQPMIPKWEQWLRGE